jgi:putative membrane protein
MKRSENEMKKASLLVSLGVLLMIPACSESQRPGTVEQSQVPQSQAPTTVGAASAVSTADFVKTVAISDMFEIQSSQLALSKQPDDDTQPFAQKMVQDHQTTSQELKALVDSGKVKATLPTALDTEHQKMLDDLRAKNGKDFDQAYDRVQQEAHQKAVDLFQKYSDSGDNADLKQWAAKTLPHLKEH